jgi:16S rRNA processing protein RimM
VAARVCVAQIGAAHGLRGEVRLHAFTEDPMAIATYGPLETEDRSRSFSLAAVRPSKHHLIARLAGVDDRAAADALRNVKLYVSRERLPQPQDEETFYHADLIGLTVEATDGSLLGTVVTLHNFGAGDLLEIARDGTGGTVLLPFTKAVVPVIDLQRGRLVVDPPEGALDAAAAETGR